MRSLRLLSGFTARLELSRIKKDSITWFPNWTKIMARDIIILECTEAKAEGKPTSRYTSTRNKKSLNTPGRLEKVKYNPFLRRRTLHRELR